MQTELPETKISGITAYTYWCEITLLPADFLNLFSLSCEKCNKLGNMRPNIFIFVGEWILCFVA